MRISLIVSALALACLACPADREHTLPGVKLTPPPVIDGRIDTEGEWATAAHGTDFVDHDTGAPGGEKTEFWLGYDAKFVYFAVRAHDSQPQTIKANEYRTNVSLEGDDTVMLSLDPFGSLNDFSAFTVNARGGTSLEIAGGRAGKREWLGEILAKGRITPEGWEAEVRIPWDIMRLPAAGVRDLRLNVERYLSRTQRKQKWAYTGGGKVEAIGVWQGVAIPAFPRHRTLKLLPFGYAGIEEGGGGILDGGLDLKTFLTDRVELVGSVRPDFRNIENQILSLDFSYFQRLAEDSRPFFQEGADYYQLGGDQRLFVSQSIDNFDAGAKSFGKLDDKTTFGILDVATFGQRNALAGSVVHSPDHLTALKVGGASLGQTGNQNNSAMFMFSRQIGGVDWYLGNQWTFDEVRGNGRRSNTGFMWDDAGWELYGEYVEVSPDFFPRLGYSPEQNLKGFNGNIGYTKPTRRWGLSETGFMIAGVDYRRFDGTYYRSQFAAQTSTTWRDGTDLDLTARFSRFNGFNDRLFTVDLEKPRKDPYRHGGLSTTFGRIQGAEYRMLSASWSYRPVQRLQTNVTYQMVDHQGWFDQMIATATYDMGQDRGISTRIVKRQDNWNGYLAFRQSGNRGTEYYVIVGDPNALTFRASLILKVTMPFEIRI